MSSITIDQAGVVRLWDDNGALVQASIIDPETGRSVAIRPAACPHVMVTAAGQCMLCCQLVVLPDQSEVTVDRLGAAIAIAAAVVCVAGLAALAWILWIVTGAQ